MKKELKYFLYIFTIFSFFIFIGNYYFSEQNKKNSYRSLILYDNKIKEFNDDLLTLYSDTDNIIEYVENNSDSNKKKYKFWDLLKK